EVHVVRALEQMLEGAAICQIDREDLRVELARQPAEHLGLPAGEGKLRAASGEAPRDRVTDPAGCSGHQRHPTFDPHRAPPFGAEADVAGRSPSSKPPGGDARWTRARGRSSVRAGGEDSPCLERTASRPSFPATTWTPARRSTPGWDSPGAMATTAIACWRTDGAASCI